ncbi:helix-turn-helix domain-containing protein [Acinetobacter pseudolwoffii]|uniref:helix-turn-helix domain-containing protein n=1 Tax=Acinetobacter pseudolwoffii TaxID=2053287 RepID=UPI002468B46D|nr:helix-turn-helix domain-containing protein [Acinetobacter pseudolwoffii]MDH5821140.1 helix-turn-helix domain-containing protein [Acinetobacter pseudolwoffii]
MSFIFTNAVKKMTVGKPTAKAILLMLADHADEKGRCFPSIQYLSKTTEFSDRAIRSAISFLEEKKFIQVHRITGSVNHYVLTLEPPKETNNEGEEDGTPSQEDSSGGDVENTVEEVREVPPNHQGNHQLNIYNIKGAKILDYFINETKEISFIELINFDQILEENFINIAHKRFASLDQSDLENIFCEFCDWYISPATAGHNNSFKTPHRWALSWINWIKRNLDRLEKLKSVPQKKLNSGKRNSGVKKDDNNLNPENFNFVLFPAKSGNE